MAELYRKSMLEKLSSPEQLDKIITIISPSFWIAAIGGGTIILVALLWSILGRLPVNINVNGIYTNRDGIHAVYSGSAGVIEEVYVAEGDVIQKGDVIARIDSSRAEDAIAVLESRKASVESVTFDSVNDVVTADNKDLIDIKIQVGSLDIELSANQALLDARRQGLETQKENTRNAEKALRSAEEAYYASLGSVDTTSAQAQYNIAQSELATAKQYLEAARQSLQSFEVEFTSVERQLKTAKDELDKAKKTGDESAISQAQKIYDSCKETYDNYVEVRKIYKGSVTEWENNVKAAQNKYNSEYDNYLSAANDVNNNNVQNTRLGNQYNIALNNYNTALSAQRSIEDSIIQLEAQISAEKENNEFQIASARAQFESTQNAILSQLDREIEGYREQIRNNEIRSTLSGTVSGINIVVGSAVNQGSEICRLSQGESSDMIIVCYVPVTEGRKIYSGMTVFVYPTTVNKQEYGHMEATVISVDSFVTSTQDMQNQLGDDSLVQTFQQNGAVIAVTCELREDPSTVSGYYWSSKKGKTVILDIGTIINADVVIEEKAPITMLIPYLKEKLTITNEGSATE